MSGETMLIAGKALLIFGIPIGLAAFELWRLRREREPNRAQPQRRGVAAADPGHAPSQTGDAQTQCQPAPREADARAPGAPPHRAAGSRP